MKKKKKQFLLISLSITQKDGVNSFPLYTLHGIFSIAYF